MRESPGEGGRTPLLILALLEEEPAHGYDLARRIREGSEGRLGVHVASLYPLLYRLERRGWIRGRWVEKPGQRRRRYYRITADGRRALASQRRAWREQVAAVNRILGPENA